jgi:hypothetical protein
MQQHAQPLTDAEIEDLEDPEQWDWEHGEEHPGRPDHRTSFAISFSRQETRALAAAARAHGVNVIDFIHDAVVAAARTADRQTSISDTAPASSRPDSKAALPRVPTEVICESARRSSPRLMLDAVRAGQGGGG